MRKNDIKMEQFRQREETIVQAAFELFAEHGTESVTMDNIAEKARIGKGTIYKHFSGKNDIFASMIIQQDQEILASLATISRDAPIMVQLKKTMRVFWEIQTQDIRKFSVYHKCDQLLLVDDMAARVRRRFERQHRLKTEFIREMIQKAIDEEIFVKESLEDLTVVATGLFQGVFDLILQGRVKPTEDLYRLIERMVFKGFMR